MEKWKEVEIELPFKVNNKIMVSNLGRVKSYSKFSDGKILEGSQTKGYKIIRFRIYKNRSPKSLKEFTNLKNEINALQSRLNALELKGSSLAKLKTIKKQLATLRPILKQKSIADLNKRAHHYHFLVHREVAKLFLPKPKKNQSIVAHINFKKNDNNLTNLKWMSQEEHTNHFFGKNQTT